MEKLLLSNKGKLASYATLHYLPPAPFKSDGDITPYTIGMVDFPEGIQVVGMMPDYGSEELETGMDVETTTYTLYQDDDGNDVVTWAFKVVNQ